MPGEGKHESSIGAQRVGYRDAGGALRYGGRVGSGFTDRHLEYLVEHLQPLKRKTSPFQGAPKPPRGALFVRPELVCEVEFTEWTGEGILRHPVYKKLVDMDPADVVLAAADGDPAGEESEAEGPDELSLGPLRRLRGGA